MGGDAAFHGIVALGVESPGVDQCVRAAEGGGVRIVAVARDTRFIVDDGKLLSRQTIEEGRFPDVGTPYDCDNG